MDYIAALSALPSARLEAVLSAAAEIRSSTWIRMVDGTDWDLIGPPRKVNTNALFYGLGRIGRFNGQTTAHYSVAEHSHHVAGEIALQGAAGAYPDKDAFTFALAGALHDMHEAILGDLTTPAQRAADAIAEMVHQSRIITPPSHYRKLLEQITDMSIFYTFGLTPDEVRAAKDAVKAADRAVFMAEYGQVGSANAVPNSRPLGSAWEGVQPASLRVKFWSATDAAYNLASYVEQVQKYLIGSQKRPTDAELLALWEAEYANLCLTAFGLTAPDGFAGKGGAA